MTPSPSAGAAVARFATAACGLVVVRDVLGRAVWEAEACGAEVRLPALPAGVYRVGRGASPPAAFTVAR